MLLTMDTYNTVLPITEPPLIFKMFVFFIFVLFVQHAADKENIVLNAILTRVFKEPKETNEPKEKKEPKEEQEEQEQVKPQKKYEDKYAEEFNLVPDELEFTEVELQKEVEQKVIIRKQLEDALECKKIQLQSRISVLQEQITDIDNDSNNPPLISKEELLKSIEEEQTNLQAVQEQQITDEEVDKAAREYSIKERLDNLKNCIVMEKTPVGNVVMFYNNSRESFEYYSDSTIPYRYLEVIGKKYVLTYRCKQIYVDMDAEIKEAERKLEEKKQKQKQKEEEEKQQQQEDQDQGQGQNQGPTVDKSSKTKNVFAKFKNYNKDTSVKVAAVPLDRPTTAKQTKPQEEKIVKERANRYSFEGKLANFNFLKKIDRKVVDKRYAISFSEFKRMQQQTQTQTK